MSTSTSWECIAFDGQRVPHGENFVPGPDYCTACKCERGEPRFCRAALCQPRQDCKSFRVGESCCDFICLDDILPTINKDHEDIGTSPDTGLRMVASAITAILSLALLLFLIHRLRQRKLRIAQHQYFEDHLDGFGSLPNDSCRNNPCCHNAVYLTGNDHVDFFLDGHMPAYNRWKPPSYYFQPGDAPPPYSEVMANDRAIQEGPLPSLNPLMIQLNSSRDSQDNSLHRNHRSVVNSLNALQIERNEETSMSVQSNPIANSTLLSDETYANSSTVSERTERRRPYSIHNPVAITLNDLNRGTFSLSNSFKNIRAEASPKERTCQCDGSYSLKKCNVCSQSDRSNRSTEDTAVTSSCVGRQNVGVEFQNDLRSGISASIASSVDRMPHPPSPIESFPSRTSSRDAPSPLDSNNEASC
ncbi:Integral membrane protein DGCR2/IDD [Armadillidium vulgare]|nr:Integral membrane protein DGCR2/IDD [Armadillidium vulgare]